MNIEHYTLSVNATYLDYEFESDGPKGKIIKRIRLRKINDKPNVYNLSFGDFNPATGQISDTTTTNNKDTDKILSTVASAVGVFFRHYPDAFVIAEGSTPSRTRLYRMRVASNLCKIEKEFRVYGLLGDKWEPLSRTNLTRFYW